MTLKRISGAVAPALLAALSGPQDQPLRRRFESRPGLR